MGRTQLSAALMLVCALKCLAMSYEELEDFENYIERTSQLSPILKKGVEADEYDVSDEVSDHAWEESGKFEGDLILNDRQRRLIVESVAEGLARNGLKDSTKRWPNGEVTYFIQVEHFTQDQVQAILGGLDDLARSSCIKFRPYRRGDRDAVVIQGNRRGCFSQVGYQGGYQVLNLYSRHPVGRGCFRSGTIVHEMLHTLGFYHMQSSPERDDYVDVQWNNIVQKARHNFRKYNSFSVSNFGVGYDYDSVLHYSRRAFSVNGQDTIVPKQNGAQIGQRVGLSAKDVQKLNRMYCDADVDGDFIETKKKTPKNKPLDIYGIGYHQGKAVIIKVLPKASSSIKPNNAPFSQVQLPEVPTSYVFDYFSKSPQILSTTKKEDIRVGKKIAELYDFPEPITEQEYKVLQDKIAAENESTVKKIGHNHDFDNFTKRMKEVSAKGEIPGKAIKEDVTLLKTINEQSDELPDPAMIDVFDRLSKIIKTHVYPSQNTDLSSYTTSGKSNDYEDVSGQHEDEDKDVQLSSKIGPKSHQMSQAEIMKSAVHSINNLYDSNNYQSLNGIENHNHPKTKLKGYYEDDSKNYNKKQDQRLVGKVTDDKVKHMTHMDPSLIGHEDDYHSLSHYRPPTEHYSAKLNNNHDESDWHHKYTPDTYSPFEYGSDYVKHIQVRDGYYNPLVPIRVNEYFRRSPYETHRRYNNNMNNQEER